MTKKELIEKNKYLEDYIQHNEYKYIPDNTSSEIDFFGTKEDYFIEKFRELELATIGKINLLQNEINNLKHLINNSTSILVSGNTYIGTIRGIEPIGNIITFKNVDYQNYEISLINSNIVYSTFVPVKIKLSSMDNIQFIFDGEANKLKKVKLVNY